MMVETGGTKSGEPFDLDDIFALAEKIERFKLARAVMGDSWLKENITQGKDPGIYLSELLEKKKQARAMLLKLTKERICLAEEE